VHSTRRRSLRNPETEGKSLAGRARLEENTSSEPSGDRHGLKSKYLPENSIGAGAPTCRHLKCDTMIEAPASANQRVFRSGEKVRPMEPGVEMTPSANSFGSSGRSC